MRRQYYQALYHAARAANVERQQAAQHTSDARQVVHPLWHWVLVVATILAVLLLFGAPFAH